MRKDYGMTYHSAAHVAMTQHSFVNHLAISGILLLSLLLLSACGRAKKEWTFYHKGGRKNEGVLRAG